MIKKEEEKYCPQYESTFSQRLGEKNYEKKSCLQYATRWRYPVEIIFNSLKWSKSLVPSAYRI